jgi:hypothetical protein
MKHWSEEAMISKKPQTQVYIKQSKRKHEPIYIQKQESLSENHDNIDLDFYVPQVLVPQV